MGSYDADNLQESSGICLRYGVGEKNEIASFSASVQPTRRGHKSKGSPWYDFPSTQESQTFQSDEDDNLHLLHGQSMTCNMPYPAEKQ